MFLVVCGSHADEKCSRVGHTRALHADCFVIDGQCLKLCLRELRVLLAFVKMFLAHLFQGRLLDKSTPRNTVECTESSVCPLTKFISIGILYGLSFLVHYMYGKNNFITIKSDSLKISVQKLTFTRLYFVRGTTVCCDFSLNDYGIAIDVVSI